MSHDIIVVSNLALNTQIVHIQRQSEGLLQTQSSFEPHPRLIEAHPVGSHVKTRPQSGPFLNVGPYADLTINKVDLFDANGGSI